MPNMAGAPWVVDLADLTFMGVSGLSVLPKAAKRAGASGGRLDIVNSRAAVRRVFEATRTAFVLDPEPAGLDSAGAAGPQSGPWKEFIDYLNDSPLVARPISRALLLRLTEIKP